MKITKTADLLADKITFTVELNRPGGYDGMDVYSDERLAELLMAVALKMRKDARVRKVQSRIPSGILDTGRKKCYHNHMA